MSHRLICFDLDGTLIPGTTSSGQLALTLGHAAELAEREAGYAAGRYGNHEVAGFDAAFYRGRTVPDIHRMLEPIGVIDHIPEVVAEVHRRGYHAVVATVAWRIVAEWFCRRFGFDAGCGPELGLDGSGRLTGVVRRHFDEWDKLAFVTSEADRLGIPLARCVAVGDGRSDIPIFRVVGISIALNGTGAANAAATYQISTRDLRDILPLIP